MTELKQYADILAQKYDQFKAQEAVYEAAKKDYENYATKVIPDCFMNAGINSVTLNDGRSIVIQQKTVCNINKQLKNDVAQWLIKQHAGALVKTQNIVSSDDVPKLVQAGIDFSTTCDMNTNSVKAWVVDALGQNGGTAQLQVQDLPKGLNFYQFEQAVIK